MAQWSSIEEVAVKYGFETEYVWVLIAMRKSLWTMIDPVLTSSMTKAFRTL